MTALIVAGVVAYVVVGLLVARAVVRNTAHGAETDADLGAMVFVATVFWPVAALFAAVWWTMTTLGRWAR